MIGILSSGSANSVQDLGRPGHLGQGIGRGGAMDRQALIAGNRLVGNPDNAAGLEIAVMPFRMLAETDCLLAVTGASAAIRVGGRLQPGWFALTIKAGEELRIEPPTQGARIVICLSGGIVVPPVLGSASTDLKSGFGGLQGRALTRGDRLALGQAFSWALFPADGFGINPTLIRPDAGGRPGGEAQTIRIMPGAEWDDFGPAAHECLTGTDWQVTQDANRQGIKLAGGLLDRSVRRELFSHGIMPGTIQVPPNGQPIIQLADANTCGGYPKIATVIEPDLWRLAQAAPGTSLRFIPVTRAGALDALRAEQESLARLGRVVNTQWTRDRKAQPA